MNLSAIAIPHVLLDSTPNIVIVETAASIGINVDLNVLEDDENNKKELIAMLTDTIIENPSIEEIAMFVNHKVNWNKKSLTKAFNNLLIYTTSVEIPNDFTYGSPTPEDPYMLPARVLYRGCLFYGLETDNYNTIEDMYEMIMRYKCGKVIDFLPINVIKQIVKSGNLEEDHSDNNYKRIWNRFNSTAYLRNYVKCINNEECIVMSVMRFNIDISHSKYPKAEYNLLRQTKGKNYVPVDDIMNFNYNKNPDIYNIDIVFNAKFPEMFYEDIDRLSKDFGNINRENSYTYMQTVYLTPTWYRGWFPCMNKCETMIMKDDMINGEDMLILATVDELFNDGKCFDSYITIMQHFRNKGLMCPYRNNKFLSDMEISRLLFLFQHDESMLDLLKELIEEQNTLKKKIEKFKISYHGLNDEGKDCVKQITNKLMIAAMYMRGWNGTEPYPIKECGSEDLVIAEEKASVSIFELYQSLDELNKYEFKNNFLSLPLVRYTDINDGSYEPSRNRVDGYTIGERLYLLIHGNTTRNENSCMRESSNWFLATCHMILVQIGEEVDFNVREIKWMS